MRKDSISKSSSAGGVAFAIPEKWTSLEIPSFDSQSSFCEAKAMIVIPDGMEPIKLATCYVHPGNHLPHELLTKFKSIQFNGKHLKGLFAGDFNSPHQTFGSRFTNVYGTSLLNGIHANNMIFLNRGEATFFNSANGEPNVLDLVLCEVPTACKVKSCSIGDNIGTDHLPVITTIQLPSNIAPQTPPVRSIFNSQVFVNTICKEFDSFDPHCQTKENIDEKTKEIQKLFTYAMESATSSVRSRKKRHLPPEILQKIQLRKALFKNMKESKDPLTKLQWTKLYNKANKEVKNSLKVFDQNELEEFVTGLVKEKDSGKMWKKLNKFKNCQDPTPDLNTPLIRPDGLYAESVDEKCEIFATRLEGIHQTPRNPFFDNEWRNDVDSFVERNEHLFSISYSDLYEEELQIITTSMFRSKIILAKKGAPGEDGITYGLLQKCPDSVLGKICTVLNLCQHFGYYPDNWKHAKVKMMPKPGKDLSQAAGYRPISLLSCIGKTFERLICDQLVSILDDKNFFNDCQAGFRKNRSTQEHLFRLSQDVLNGFKKKECTIGVFLDVASAFDAVWTNGLKFKLQKIGLPKRLLSILCSFLDGRSLQVWLESGSKHYKSRSITLRAGTPQGACLSPILYLIFVNDLPSQAKPNLSYSQYADDIGLWASHLEPKIAEVQIQEALKQIESWCKRWQISLHPSKSQVILFSRCPNDKKHPISLSLFGEKLKISENAIFLGLTVDSRLTWEPEYKKLVEKGSNRLNLLRSISSLCKKSNPGFMTKIFKALILPIFEYGCVAHVNAADVHLNKLQVLQNSAMRLCLKLPKYIPETALHDASGLNPIATHLRQFAARRLEAMKSTSPGVKATIEKYHTVKWNKHHKSPLDVI